MTLVDAIDVIIHNDPRAANRLDPLADFAIEQLGQHGLPVLEVVPVANLASGVWPDSRSGM